MNKLSTRIWNTVTKSIVALAAMTLPIEAALAIAPTHSVESFSANIAQAHEGQIRVEYQPAKGELYQAVANALERNQVFGKSAESLSQLFSLPRDITLSFQECGQANAYYVAKTSQIVMCYELLERFRKDFASAGGDTAENATDTALYAATFVFLHELGHALIYDWDLPVLGRSEDAADQFATVFFSLGGRDSTFITWAAALQLFIEQQNTSQTVAWDEHSSQLQRFYNIACISYGSNPADYPEIPEAVLPTSRRSQCVDESQRITRSWLQLMQPHVRR
jgi:Putative metallopeptidase